MDKSSSFEGSARSEGKIVFTKRSILEFVLSTGITPNHEDFNELCLSWIFELFPATDPKKVNHFVNNYCLSVKGTVTT